MRAKMDNMDFIERFMINHGSEFGGYKCEVTKKSINFTKGKLKVCFASHHQNMAKGVIDFLNEINKNEYVDQTRISPKHVEN
jgi:hypothetical protein